MAYKPSKFTRGNVFTSGTPRTQTQSGKNEGRVLPFEAIIMAGGKGERLSPLTDSLPKPLLPVGGKPIVLYMVEKLLKTGVRDITFCLNYLGEKIQECFGDGSEWKARFEYIFEKQPLGTIGGVSLKEQFKFNDILIVNGDLLTNINLERFFTWYLENDADMAVATIPYTQNLPYGIVGTGEGSVITSIQEKPTFVYHINSGIYLLRREILELIPQGRPFDAVDLIESARLAGLKVLSFPLLDYWIDIGKIEDYEKAKKDIDFLDL